MQLTGPEDGAAPAHVAIDMGGLAAAARLEVGLTAADGMVTLAVRRPPCGDVFTCLIRSSVLSGFSLVCVSCPGGHRCPRPELLELHVVQCAERVDLHQILRP
jgi:hypothetical protein